MHSIPPDPKGSAAQPRPLAEVLPATVAWEYRAIPLGWQGQNLLIGVVPADPPDEKAMAVLAAAAGVALTITPLNQETFERMFATMYPGSVLAPETLKLPAKTKQELNWWERHYAIWASSPLVPIVESILILLLVCLTLTLLLLVGRVFIVGLVGLVRVLLNPFVLVAVLLLILMILLRWLRRSKPQ